MNNLLFDSPQIFKKFTNLVAAQSTRLGGISPIPYCSLNLGFKSGDTLENVLQNRKLLLDALSIAQDQLAISSQIHSDNILVADCAGNFEGYDAIISNKPNLFVAVTIADCTPILVFDAKNKAVGAIHAGWKGTVAQIVTKTLEKMKSYFGTNAEDCFAYIGTCIDECNFEVGNEVSDLFEDNFKEFDPNRDKFLVNLKKANKFQLLAFGIPESQIEVSDFSTVSDNNRYFSYRIEKGKTGRMMALIGFSEV